MIGADILLNCLENQGVNLVFGLPGGSVIPLYDRLKEFRGIQHILMRHEQGAVHAAEGYARVTGKVGVAFATSGPGAANMMTGLANAYMDSIPLVVISGQVARSYLGKDSFQEACVTGMSQPITKANILVQKAEDIAQVIANAFFVAKTGRPGPVLVDIPKDVFLEDVPNVTIDVPPYERFVRKLQETVIGKDLVRKVQRLLSEAEKPLIIVGGGINNKKTNKDKLARIAKAFDCPVAQTLMANGVVDSTSPYFLGMLGMHGTTMANYAVQHCDVLLGIGMRFDDRVTGDTSEFAPHAKIIHVDIDSAEIDKNIHADLPIVGNGEAFMDMLIESIDGEKDHTAWRNEIKREDKRVRVHKGEHVSPDEVFPYINSLLDERSIVVTDVGQHQMWSALYLTPHGCRRFLTSGGLGTMGYGLPAAIGAQFADEQAKVILITGDGSFQMNLQELAIIRQFGIPIKILLMNNGYLGMVRQWQELFHDGNYAETTLDIGPEWDKLAEAYQISYTAFSDMETLKKKLPELLESDNAEFINIMTNQDANVYPMVPAGCSLDNVVGDFEDETYLISDR